MCVLPSKPEHVKAPGVRLPAAKSLTQMVLRATALRGSVPQEWLSDFRTAMDGFGLVAMTQKTQLADIYRELQGVKWVQLLDRERCCCCCCCSWPGSYYVEGPAPTCRPSRWRAAS